MTWAWHSSSPHEDGEFARARAQARVDVLALRGRAVRTVAEQAVDADDFRRLVAMLGLDDEPGGQRETVDGSYGFRRR